MLPSGYTLEEESERLKQELAEVCAEIDRLAEAKEGAEASAAVRLSLWSAKEIWAGTASVDLMRAM